MSVTIIIGIGLAVFWFGFDGWVIFIPSPKVGEIWETRNTDKDPWHEPSLIEILEIKRGWVKWRFKGLATEFTSSIWMFKATKKYKQKEAPNE